MARRSLRFRIVNVFAEDSRWSGNALAVIEDARDLSDEEMQAIALQFNQLGTLNWDGAFKCARRSLGEEEDM
jgi:predicted PhzF superfamily epimerase YddE/YHI9